MDKRVVGEIYKRYSKEIHGYLCSLGADTHVAEDLMQEVFAKAIISLPEGHTNIRAWLYTVARNLYYNHVKRSNITQSVVEKLSYMQNGNVKDPLEQVIAKEKENHLQEALSNLDKKYRDVMILQYYEGLSQKDIAKRMKISPENVRVLVHRAKKMLKEYLENEI